VLVGSRRKPATVNEAPFVKSRLVEG